MGYLSAPEAVSEVHLLIHNHLDLNVSPQISQHLGVVTTLGMPLEIFLSSSTSFHTIDTQCKTVQTQLDPQTKLGQKDAPNRLAWL